MKSYHSQGKMSGRVGCPGASLFQRKLRDPCVPEGEIHPIGAISVQADFGPSREVGLARFHNEVLARDLAYTPGLPLGSNVGGLSVSLELGWVTLP